MTLKLNLIAEEFIGTANGVYTAYVEAVESLKKIDNIELSINGTGTDYDVVHSHTIGLEYILKSFRFKNNFYYFAYYDCNSDIFIYDSYSFCLYNETKKKR
jgi:hypothetical protein